MGALVVSSDSGARAVATSQADPTSKASIKELCEEAERLWADETNQESQAKSVQIYARISECGNNSRATYRLGCAYYYGRGVKADREKAYSYFAKPEMDGMRSAVYFRGLILMDTRFVMHDDCLAFKELKRAQEMGVERAQERIKIIEARSACPVCKAMPTADATVHSQECVVCGSLEPQRVFMNAYRNSIHYAYELGGKNGLLLGASRGEKALFKAIGAAAVETIDLLADSPDMVGELRANTRLQQDSFDFVFASCMLAPAHDCDATLREIHRLLRPGGVFFAVHLIENRETKPNKRKTAGSVVLSSAKNASYPFGVEGLTDSLLKHFQTQHYTGEDPVTKQKLLVFASRKVSAASTAGVAQELSTYTREMILENAANERETNRPVSERYEAQRKLNPSLSYTKFTIGGLVRAVTNFEEHPTLGANVTDHSKQQGIATFQMYKSILEVVPGDRVIDYGCGSLRVGAGFIEYLRARHFFALDVVKDFYEIGLTMLDRSLIEKKDIKFHTIDEKGIEQATKFGADHIYASAVIFHIHPHDIEEAMSNLVRLASKPGARLIFDAKITTNGKPASYAQMHDKSGWAWPLSFYQAALAPLELVGVHRRAPYNRAPGLDGAHLEFRRPLGA